MNKITDEKAEVKRKSVRARRNIEEPTHNMAASHRRLSDTINIQDDLSQRKETRPDIPHADKLSVLKTRPWINKPIEELTEFVSDRTSKYTGIVNCILPASYPGAKNLKLAHYSVLI